MQPPVNCMGGCHTHKQNPPPVNCMGGPFFSLSRCRWMRLGISMGNTLRNEVTAMTASSAADLLRGLHRELAVFAVVGLWGIRAVRRHLTHRATAPHRSPLEFSKFGFDVSETQEFFPPSLSTSRLGPPLIFHFSADSELVYKVS
eukprot:COSAG02_NODE_1038_length_15049_cov_895.063144_4_plen_145_part_00